MHFAQDIQPKLFYVLYGNPNGHFLINTIIFCFELLIILNSVKDQAKHSDICYIYYPKIIFVVLDLISLKKKCMCVCFSTKHCFNKKLPYLIRFIYNPVKRIRITVTIIAVYGYHVSSIQVQVRFIHFSINCSNQFLTT